MILRQYVNKEIVKTTLAILTILVLLFISTRFIRYIQLAVDGSISAYAAFVLMALKVPSVAGFLLPMSFFIAMLTTMGRLYAENEMAIIQNSGIGELGFAKMLLPLSLIIAFSSGVMSFFVTPWANFESAVFSSQESAKARLGGLIAGRFSESKDKNSVVFIESKDQSGEIKNLFAVNGLVENSGSFEIQIANSGKIKKLDDNGDGSLNDNSTSYLVLNSGTNYAFNNNNKTWQTTQYEQYFMPLVEQLPIEVQRKTSSETSLELLKANDKESIAELHWRLSAPLSVLILVFMAVPLAKTQPRKGKFSRLFPAIMVYMVYALLMMNGRQLIEDDKIPSALGFWWIHSIAIVFCWWRYSANKKLKRLSKRKLNV